MAAHPQRITPVAVDATVGRSLKILARIPRTASCPAATPPLQLPVGDAAEQVLLVEEAPVPPSNMPKSIYFVDTGHGQPECAAGSACETACKSEKCRTDSSDAKQHSPLRQKQGPEKGQQSFAATGRVSNSKNDWAKNLSQLHTRLVPYSGLIVAMALVTSASLLYWLTLAPASAPFESQEIRSASASHWPSVASNEATVSQQASDHGAASSDSEPVFAVPTVSIEKPPLMTSAPVISESVPDSLQLAEAGSRERVTDPDLEKIILPPQDANDDFLDSLFPSTDFVPLDFSLIGVSPPENLEQDLRGTQPISPAMADRSLNAPASPVRR